MAYIQPKNWNEFQHYKDRSPTWIKLHKSILDNYEYQCLPLASRALAPMLWLLASEYEDGKIPADLNRIAFRVRVAVDDLESALSHLISSGFFVRYQDASGVLAECLPREEKRRDREEKEKERALVVAKPRPSKRAPVDFTLTTEMIEWARAEAPGVNVMAATAKFLDHTFAKGKTDWPATWRNWIREDFDQMRKPVTELKPKRVLGLADQVMANFNENQRRLGNDRND